MLGGKNHWFSLVGVCGFRWEDKTNDNSELLEVQFNLSLVEREGRCWVLQNGNSWRDESKQGRSPGRSGLKGLRASGDVLESVATLLIRPCCVNIVIFLVLRDTERLLYIRHRAKFIIHPNPLRLTSPYLIFFWWETSKWKEVCLGYHQWQRWLLFGLFGMGRAGGLITKPVCELLSTWAREGVDSRKKTDTCWKKRRGFVLKHSFCFDVYLRRTLGQRYFCLGDNWPGGRTKSWE